MDQREHWEDKIKNVLALECDGITASQDLKDRIDEEILRSRKEAGNMKKLSAKKLIIGVVAGCLLVSGGVFAAGHVVSFSSHSYWTNASRNYGDMEKQQQKLGYAADTVESFANGYQFDSVTVGDTQGEDEDGNAVYTYKFMNVHYKKSGEPAVSLYIQKPVESQVRTEAPDAARTCGDITLYYDSATFKFVPPDYELTAEDKANQERGDYHISYGSDEVETQQNFQVTWEKEGIVYELIGFDLNLTADDMFDMAEEIMGTK